jgi:3-hydroxymyristoyl/3-hydroxydecanoyl-(acyl carrier protein) dehydratase
VIDVPADHPAFDGHFPGHPILPGALLLDGALAAICRERGLELARWRIAAAKFLGAVAPGELLMLDHETGPGGRIRFEVRAATRLVASGSLVPA